MIGNRVDERYAICDKLQRLGYEKEHDIKLYGEKFHLVSNPIPDGDGFAIEAVTLESAEVRRMRIPISLVYTLKKELSLNE